MKCPQKVAYRSRAKARKALLGARYAVRNILPGHRERVPDHEYECPDCGLWHLTSWPKGASTR